MRKAQIISINRNNINRITHKKSFLKLSMYLCTLGIVLFVSVVSLGGANIRQIGGYMGYVFDPVNSLYSDNSSVIFTSTSLVSKEKLSITLPVTGTTPSIDVFGNIELLVKDSIMIKAPESGVVEDIGTTLDGIKYIKIAHSVNISSLIENVDFVGVAKGENIKLGQDIATSKEGSVVVLKLFEDDRQISNVKINQSKIVWQK